jgi:hypothetical protein
MAGFARLVARSIAARRTGSMLNDKVGKGIAILVLSILARISAAVLIGFVLGPAVWIWDMGAAISDARQWNRVRGIMS